MSCSQPGQAFSQQTLARLSALFLALGLIVLLLQPVSVLAAKPLKLLFEEALADSQQGDFASALPLWDQVLEVDPNDAAAWSNRGNVRLALGDSAGAILDQTQAMQLEPENPDPHLNRGTAEEALHDWSAAAADYEWILERDSSDADALYNLGNVRGSEGRWAEAETLFSRAMVARSDFAMARSSYALALYQQGDLALAQKELRKLIRRYPMFADARAALSGLLWREGFKGEAESHWAAAAGLDSRYRNADWLTTIRRWPPQPTKDLMTFLSLES